MKKFLAIFGSALLVITFATPVSASPGKWTVSQLTLATFAGNSTLLTNLQKQQIRATVEANPNADKFICTGIRFYSQPMSMNIMVRKRAKAACEFAKELNPELSTWFQNKPTKARSFAGKVLLTVKTPDMREQANQVTLDSEMCKIQENSRARKLGDPNPDFAGEREILGRYRGNATAFPFAPTILPTKGEIKVAFIYVDWEDLPGTSGDYEYYKQQIQMFEDFYWMASENKLKMNVQLSAEWFRIEGSYKEFTMTQEQEAQSGYAPKKQFFYDGAVAASDPETDYSDVDIVFFAIPRAKSVFFHGGPHEFNWIHNGHLDTQEGKIYDIAAAGDWFLKNDSFEPPWVYYVHETGHMIGVPHQANEDQEARMDSRLWVRNPLNGYDIMSNQGGSSRTMTSWLRWLAGWLDDDQVACITKEAVTENYFELFPINQIGADTESLVIRLSDTKAVVVESRRFDEYFDRRTRNSKDGLIVYTVDATKGSAQANQVLVSPRDITELISEPGWRDGYELDAFFFQGDSVVIDGIQIEAYSIGKESDVVRVTRSLSAGVDGEEEPESHLVFENQGREPDGKTFCGCCGCVPDPAIH